MINNFYLLISLLIALQFVDCANARPFVQAGRPSITPHATMHPVPKAFLNERKVS
jgi:hypothetical protein